jgi:hypothetical protein
MDDLTSRLEIARVERRLADVLRWLWAIYNQGKSIMATQAELAKGLTDLTAQVAKIGAESTVTLQKVTDLEAALAAGGPTTPEVDAAFAALKAQVQKVDDMIPDAPPPPPAP